VTPEVARIAHLKATLLTKQEILSSSSYISLHKSNLADGKRLVGGGNIAQIE